MLPGTALDGGNLDFLGIFGRREAAKKKVHHTFGNLESQKEVYFGYGEKHRRIGAAATITPPQTDDNGNAILQSFLSKLFKKKSAEDTLVPPLWGKRIFFCSF